MKHVKWLAPVLLILGLWGYHLLAANQAERDIAEALQQLETESETGMSISHSDISVHPFSGDIEFMDINFIDDEHILRSSSILFDLTYFNFLTIYFRGAKYGLQNLEDVSSEIENPSAIFRSTISEYKAETLVLNYEGNFFDLIVHFVREAPFELSHRFDASMNNFRYVNDNASWGTFDADSISIQVNIPAGATSLAHGEKIFIKSSEITWHPPESVQKKYGFFIRGFEYDPDNLPVDSLHFQLARAETTGNKVMNIDLYTELFHVRSIVELATGDSLWSQAQLENGRIFLVESSTQFRNFLENAQSLLGISPPDSTEPVIEFSGPLADPVFRLNN